MNSGKIVSAAYSWISAERVLWYLLFFGISIPFLLLFPQIFEKNYFGVARSIAVVFYDILYLAVILGVLLLIQFCLTSKKEQVKKLSVTKVIDAIFLVFVELFYALVWNIHFPFRAIQFLLIIASALVYYYYTIIQTELLLTVSYLCFTAYFILVVYNAIRIFFSTTAFCHKGLSLKDSVKESWNITEGKFYEIFSSGGLVVLLSVALFLFLAISLGTIASLMLKYFFVDSVALSLGFRAGIAFALAPAIIAYHYAMIEVYLELSNHKSSEATVKRLLANRVLAPKRFAAKAKPKAKKKVVKRRK
jgi:hypothetical protein